MKKYKVLLYVLLGVCISFYLQDIFSTKTFASDFNDNENYKAGEKVMYDICAGYHNSSAGDMKINYSGYNSQCTAFIMEIKQ